MVAPLALFLASLAGGSLMERNRNKKRAEAEKQNQAMVDRNLDLAINPDMVKSNGINLDVSGLQGPMQFQRRAAGGPSDMGRVERFANTTLPINAQSAPRLGQEQRQIGALQNISRMKSLTPAQGAVNDFALQQVMKPESESKRFVREIYGQEQAVNPILGRSMPHADGLRGSASMNSPQGRQAMLQRRTLEALPVGTAASLVANQVFPESKAPTPYSDIAKARLDLENGLITPSQFAQIQNSQGAMTPYQKAQLDISRERLTAPMATAYKDAETGMPVFTDRSSGQFQVNGEVIDAGRLVDARDFDEQVKTAQPIVAGIRRAQDTLDLVKNNPNAFEYWRVREAKAKGMVPFIGDKLATETFTPEENTLRARVAREGAAIINELYGAALSAGEQARADTFTPAENDGLEQMLPKLEAALTWAESKGKEILPSAMDRAEALLSPYNEAGGEAQTFDTPPPGSVFNADGTVTTPEGVILEYQP
jgi:hypothetical protein